MTISPIFYRELLVTARRERYYVLRFVFGAVLFLFIFGPVFLDGGIRNYSELEHRELARLNESFFAVIMVFEGLAVLFLTPALVAGSIAEEKQRRGVDVLLATTLSSFEIVLGKLLARMCQLIVIVSLTVPILCLLSLNGGVDVGVVVLGYLITLTSGLLLAALAIAVSTLSARPLQAVILAYLLDFAWLIAPALPNPFPIAVGPGPPTVLSWVGAGLTFLQQWVAASNPIYVATTMPKLGARNLIAVVPTLIALQLGASAVLVVGSALVFRPLALRAGSSESRFKPLAFILSRRTFRPRRACGDRPMVWKECHVARATVLTRFVTVVAVIALLIAIGPESWRIAFSAFQELASAGYGALRVNQQRDELNAYLRVVVTLLYIGMTLAVAARSALSCRGEFEKETWKSLIATPLDASEILIGKILGSLWGIRWLASIYLALVFVGVAAGAVHPLAGILVVFEAAVFLGFASTLGTRFSLASKSSFRALGGTLLTLFMINGGFLTCCLFVASESQFFAITPLVQAISLAKYSEVAKVSDFISSSSHLSIGLVIFLSLVCYGVAAYALFRFSVHRFELIADRPRQPAPVKLKRLYR